MTHSQNHTPSTEPSPAPTTTRPPTRFRWRTLDIVIAAVLGVVIGLLFTFWNFAGYAGFMALDALTPGFGGLVAGVWLLGGVVGALIIRKPGAALFVELLAAVVSMLLGSQWAVETVYSGIAQGLGAEAVFLLSRYRRFGVGAAVLAGIGSALFAWTLELFLSGNIEMSSQFLVIYLVCLVVSGAVLAGLAGWALTRALARTGALDRFAAGREVRGLA
ncbi:ECF transporter S component [Brevibacterium jeotgali]|uniref:Energy-coupling factor transport system substrate-specific component n=1 Tax=Brevibacterium jeotgali TaxID=1262550 RepID=A0A2H1L192_9MICO|nr:ECF transporter S component [Brevibacterium jeotgali]TWC02145.1 energy-coupling factor transport system substrate-specific component [Brevibacterium jeotgali]SMY10505.1 energy-coupling factor transport system substrate-specific component [Brevibacterium jeotgali]